jgi:hypothetical protein
MLPPRMHTQVPIGQAVTSSRAAQACSRRCPFGDDQGIGCRAGQSTATLRPLGWIVRFARVQAEGGGIVEQRATESPERRRVAAVAQVAQLVDEGADDGAGAAPLAPVVVAGAAHQNQRLALDFEAAQSVAPLQPHARLAPKRQPQPTAPQQRLELEEEQLQQPALRVDGRRAGQGRDNCWIEVQVGQSGSQRQLAWCVPVWRSDSQMVAIRARVRVSEVSGRLVASGLIRWTTTIIQSCVPGRAGLDMGR